MEHRGDGGAGRGRVGRPRRGDGRSWRPHDRSGRRCASGRLRRGTSACQVGPRRVRGERRRHTTGLPRGRTRGRRQSHDEKSSLCRDELVGDRGAARRRTYRTSRPPLACVDTSAAPSPRQRRSRRGARRTPRLVDPQPVQQRVVGAPAAAHAHRQVEVDAARRARARAPRRAAVPIALIIRRRRRSGCPSATRSRPTPARARASRSSRGSSISSTSTSTACGTSWSVRRSTCSRTSSASSTSSDWSERSSAGKRNGPSGMQRREVLDAAPPRPRRVRAEIGKISSRDLERRRRPAAPASVRGAVEPVDLVDRDDDRHAGARAAASAMKRSPGPTPCSPLTTSSAASDSASSRSTRRCMRSVSASRGRWTPGRSTSTSCVSPRRSRRRGSRGASSAACRRRSRPCGRRCALTSVDLPTFGRPASATKPRAGARSHAHQRQQLGLEREHLAVVGLVVHAGEVQRAVDDRLAQVLGVRRGR